jgi:hypothetical protein
MATNSHLEKTRRVQIQISPDMHRKLAAAAKDSGVSKAAFLRVALEREFSHQEQLDREINRYQVTPRSHCLNIKEQGRPDPARSKSTSEIELTSEVII